MIPFFRALAEQEQQWIADHYRSLLSPKWHKIVVLSGTGSCWGQSCHPDFEVTRDGDDVRIRAARKDAGPGIMVESTSVEIDDLQKSLYRYATHHEAHGCWWGNSCEIYSIEVQGTPDAKLERIFYGYGTLDPPQDAEPFKEWIKRWQKKLK
jgi:hypothetical protein